MTWGVGRGPNWGGRRKTTLERDPVCRLRYPGCTVLATQVDHIVNLAAGGTDSLENLQGVCAHCHKVKTEAEASAARPRLRREPERHPGG